MPHHQRWLTIFVKSIRGETRKHLANPWLARVAFQLEARQTQSTILNNVSRDNKTLVTRCAELEARKPPHFGVRHAGTARTF
jgi:hypothetical protein